MASLPTFLCDPILIHQFSVRNAGQACLFFEAHATVISGLAHVILLDAVAPGRPKTCRQTEDGKVMDIVFLLVILVAAWVLLKFVFKRAVYAAKKFMIKVAAVVLVAAVVAWAGFAAARALSGSAALSVLMAAAGAAGAALIAGYFFYESRNKKNHVRGGLVVDADKLVSLSKKADPKAEIFIGKAAIPHELENRHCLVAGSTGSGKSQVFYQIAGVARRRQDAAIIGDLNAEFLSRFYDPSRGDVILAPLDKRTASWSPLAEIFGDWDAERIAKSIIPPGEGSSTEWNHYGQVLLTAILAKIWRAGGKNFELTQMILSASNEELAEQLAGTQAAQFFAPGAERMLSSIRAIVASHCQPFAYLSPGAGRDAFSITKFIQSEARDKRGAWLYFPVRADFFASFRPLVAAQMDIAIGALLSTDDDEHRRVWFFIDEFASWGQLGSIGDLLTKARKKGGVGVLGLQTVSQLREAYGQNGAQTLLANLGSWVTLRAGDAETAEYMSRAVGDEQIRRFTSATSKADGRRTESSSEQIATERVIMPAELQTLADLVGVLNIAGPLPAGWVDIPICPLKRTVSGFELVGQPTAFEPPASPDSPEPDIIGEIVEEQG